MKRTRRKDLSQIVFTKSSLETIWSALERHAAEGQNTSSSNVVIYPPTRPTITIVSTGSLTTEADDKSVFDKDVIDQVKSLSVTFQYTNYPAPRSIRIQLFEGERRFWSSSSFTISGDDPRWVDATFLEFERMFDSFRPQSMMFDRLRPLLFFILSVALGFSLLPIFRAIFPEPTSEPTPAWLQYIITTPMLRHPVRALALFLIGAWPASIVINWVAKLWPSIEFDFGPEHLKTRKQWRGRAATVTVLMLLPILLDTFERNVLGWH